MTEFTFDLSETNDVKGTYGLSGTSGARIKVIGVGGAGTNAVNFMINKNVQGVDFYVANTDLQALEESPAPNKIQLGTHLTRGQGTGGKPHLGQAAAEEAQDQIERIMEDTDMLFITAGMGGGTGTGAAPVVAKIARDHGILTVGVVTKPFSFERQIRMKHADDGISRLRKNLDTLIVIPNERLLQFSDRKLSIVEAFDMADKVLLDAVRGISDVIVVPSRVNVDFYDVQTIMGNMGDALMGTGYGEGENAAIEAITNAINCPLLERANVRGAKGILINYIAGPDLPINAIDEANRIVVEEADKKVEVIWGLAIDDTFGKKVKITVIATGFGNDASSDIEESSFQQAVPFQSAMIEREMVAENLNGAHARNGQSMPKKSSEHIINSSLFEFETISKDDVFKSLACAAPDRSGENLDTPTFMRKQKKTWENPSMPKSVKGFDGKNGDSR